jgi:hypothetical protein
MGVLGWFKEAFTEAFYSILFSTNVFDDEKKFECYSSVEEASKERINLFSLLFVARIF